MKYEDKLAAGRRPCQVPGCRRTFKPTGDPATETICGTHWRTVPKYMRRRLSRLHDRYAARFGDQAWHVFPAGSPKRLEAVRLARMCSRAWEACKRAATERALGL